MLMEPRYAALAREIALEIANGQHPVGSLLPNEIEFAEQRGVSRATVRAALRQLQELGLISRRRRAGTRVEATHPRTDYAPSLTTLEDLIHYAAETERRVHEIAEIVADDTLAARIRCRPGQRWLRLLTTRGDPHRPDRPIACTSVYIDPAYGPGVRRRVRDSKELISTIIEQEHGTYATEVRQEIRAVSLSPAVARRLGCEAGAPALEVTRHYRDQTGRSFEITISVQPADRFSYVLSLRRVPEAASPAIDPEPTGRMTGPSPQP
jgi:DNA-binding GntR family transcriptional regulator